MKREISLRQGIARNIPCLTTKDFPVRDLAKRESPARSCSHEILELAERESSVDRALNPHGRRGDPVGRRRATGAYARGLLGGNRDSGRDAIQSWRYPHALHRTRSRYGPGRVSRSSGGKLFRSK